MILVASLLSMAEKPKKNHGIFLVTQACHLEARHSLTTDSFLNAFRGQSQLSYSDNGTNFFGARTSLQDSLNEGIRYSKEKIPADIQWDFNPPSAPHFDRKWEKLIQTA